ncbi:MAG: dimethylarginine dimethylaminohydrolase family protein [Allosphingosinicella sp.]
MLLDLASAEARTDLRSETRVRPHWGVASETGRLTDVLLSAPTHLSMVPCNAVTRLSLAQGLALQPRVAAQQHEGLAAALTGLGVRCHWVTAAPNLTDLVFTRDPVLMSPWGLIELRPAAFHRRAEPSHVVEAVRALGAAHWRRIDEGRIEGGDICILREGHLLIGYSGDRTDEVGARALGGLFERMGWDVIYAPFDAKYLHLDTIFTMLSHDCAVACPDALGDELEVQLGRLGVGIIPATMDEVARLGANLLCLGGGRILAPADNVRLNAILDRSGFEVTAVEVDQFTRCGGGLHCLTMPLAREPDQAR